MSEDAAQEDKTEDATPRQRQKFRDRGEVAKSQELGAAVMLTASAMAMAVIIEMAQRSFKPMATTVWTRLDEAERFAAAPGLWLSSVVGSLLWALAPSVSILAVLAVLAHVLQTGPMWAPKSLEFKPQKLNPLQGFKRIFLSKETAFNMIKTSLKVVLLTSVAAVTLSWLGADLPTLTLLEPVFFARLLGKIVLALVVASAAVMLVVGIADFIWQRHRMEERMKMTKEQAKREYKEMEGDPLIKGQRRARHRELLSINQMLEELPSADVVVTNPTHVAVALRYRPHEGPPCVIAKGLDHQAQRIKAKAAEHDIPMVENVPLARALHRDVSLGQPIPETFYRAVAEVLAFVMRRKSER